MVDDGSELTARIVEHRPEVAAGLAGVTEETTTGVARLRVLEAAGKLTFPAITANDARCKHLFFAATAPASPLAAIDRLTNLTFPRPRVLHRRLRLDSARASHGRRGAPAAWPMRSSRSTRWPPSRRMDGNRVAMLEEALPDADVLIARAPGVIDCVPAEALRFLKDGVDLRTAATTNARSRSTGRPPARRCGPA